MDYQMRALEVHEKSQGKIEVLSKVKVKSKEDLALAYTPGVAEPCKKIHQHKENVYKYTSKGNLVAVVTDGTAVLGLGDIGPEAAMPVMEGKAILFKEFANIDAVPLCLDTKDVDKIVETIKLLAPTFGGINLEDIAAPRCFEIEEKLKEVLDIPVFHDDQHGTAIVVLAAMINALKLAKKNIKDITVVVNGAGAAGTAITKMLLDLGPGDIILCDRSGILDKNSANLSNFKKDIAQLINKNNKKGNLEDALEGADVFIGVSSGNIVSKEMISRMNKNAIVFALANPIPEIMPNEALEGGALVVGTGRSDFPNQINNVLAFPGIFRGALDARARMINDEMKVAAIYGLAGLIDDKELNTENIIPDVFDKRVSKQVAKAVAKAAIESGVATKMK